MDRNDALTVTRLPGLIQDALSREPLLKGLWVRGEISNFKRHSSGHLYFTVKDKETAIRAVMFRGNADKLGFKPEDGQDCFFRGYVSLYARETQVQFYAEAIEAAGQGADALALDELKKRLTAKGYFDPAHKRPIPALPEAIGVITSPTGAVIQDIRKVVWRRYPGMPILLYPSLVQGKDAASSVVNGLSVMEKTSVSVIILARGGGSAEDLSAFNREEVVEALHRCSKPVISAVGHETDVTLTDLVADLRAATPSMAAELAVPVKAEWLSLLHQQQGRLSSGLERNLRRQRERLQRVCDSYILTEPKRLFDPHRDRLARLHNKIQERMQGILTEATGRFQQGLIKLEALSPLATLARGYAICRDQDGAVVDDASRVIPGQKVRVSLSRGSLSCKVEEVLTQK